MIPEWHHTGVAIRDGLEINSRYFKCYMYILHSNSINISLFDFKLEHLNCIHSFDLFDYVQFLLVHFCQPASWNSLSISRHNILLSLEESFDAYPRFLMFLKSFGFSSSTTDNWFTIATRVNTFSQYRMEFLKVL